MIKKEIIFSILTIIFSSIFALLLLEIALRIAVKNPNLKVKIFPTNVGWNKDDFNKLHEEIYAKQWQLKKVKNFIHKSDANEFNYKINTYECLDLYVRSKCDIKNPEAFHYGDSMTFGFGLPVNKTWTFLFDDGEGRHINFGVPGDNILHMLDKSIIGFKSKKLNKDPKNIIFYSFLGNDINEAMLYLREGYNIPFNIGQLPFNPEESYSKKILIRVYHKYLFYYSKFKEKIILLDVVGNWSRFLIAEQLPNGYHYIPQVIRRFDKSQEKTFLYQEEHMTYIAEAMRSRLTELKKIYKGEIIIVFFPPKGIYKFREDLSLWKKRVNQLTVFEKELDITYIDFLDHIEWDEFLGLYFKIDSHLNEKGHKKMKEIISKFIY